MKIGIIVAMDKELQELQRVFNGTGVTPQKCGIGKVNAALGAAELISRYHPDAIISTGCAGGHGEGIRVQDVVVGAEVGYHDVYCGLSIDDSTVYGQVQGMPARFLADPYLLSRAIAFDPAAATAPTDGQPMSAPTDGHRPPTMHQGLIVTGDWFVDSQEKMRQIVANFPEARAVDMESAAIAHACYKYGVPFLSMRIVSDVPLSDDHASQYHDFWRQLADRSFHITRAFVESL